MCSCGSESETTARFILRCQNHVISRSKLKNVYNLDQTKKLRNYRSLWLRKIQVNLNKEMIKLC